MSLRLRLARLAAGRAGDSLLPALLGLAATPAFAPFGQAWLLPLALAGLLALWQGVSARRAAWRGLVFGFAHFCSGVYWVYISIHHYGGAPVWLGVLLTALLALYLALYPALVGYVLVRLQPAGSAAWLLALFPLLWLAAELLRGWIGSGIPWLSPGYAFIDTPLKNLAPVMGVYGLGAVIALLAAALWLLLAGSPRTRPLALAVPLVLAMTLWLLPAPLRWTAEAGEPVAVSLVQGNIAQELKWRPEKRAQTLAHYERLTRPLWGTRLIIWPEVAIPALRHQVRAYLDALQEIAAANGSTLLLGILVRDTPEAPLYNALISLGRDTGGYYKRHLVPFGEYFPVPDFLLDVGSVLGLQYSDFSSGPELQPLLQVGAERLGVSICFEDVFGDEIRRDLPQAGLLLNVTNDAWFADSLAPHQHLEIARMRALETGRSLLRVANTGISAVIGPDGGIRQASPQFEISVLQAEVTPRRGSTPYVRWGDAPLWGLCALGLGGCMLLARLRSRRPPERGGFGPAAR